MENEQLQQPSVPAAAPLGDLSLGDYRASREPKPEKADSKQPAPSLPNESGDELETEGTPEQQVERKKKQGGFQKTISRQTDEIADLKRQLGEKSPVIPAAAAPAATAAATPAAAVPEPLYTVPKPKLEDCDGIEDFTEKLSDWKADERDWRKDAKAKLATHQASANALSERWKTNVETFKTDHEDYDEALASVKDIKLSGAHQRIFLDSEHGPALAYELANDPELLKQIAAMTPTQAAHELGILSAKYREASAAPDKEIKVSAAPRPFTPLSGNTTRVKPNADNLSLADYRKGRESGRI